MSQDQRDQQDQQPELQPELQETDQSVSRLGVAEIVRAGLETAEAEGDDRVLVRHLTEVELDDLVVAAVDHLRSVAPGRPSPKTWRVVPDARTVLLTWLAGAARLVSQAERARLRRLGTDLLEELRSRELIRDAEQPGAVALAPDTGLEPTSGRVVNETTLGAWLLKLNPRVWDLDRWVNDGARPITRWAVQDNYRSAMMAPGQAVALWVGGTSRVHPAGVLGIGTVTGPCVPSTEEQGAAEQGYWLNRRAARQTRLLAQVDVPLWSTPVHAHVCRTHPALKDLEVLRQANGSNPTFLTPDQLAAVQELHAGRG